MKIVYLLFIIELFPCHEEKSMNKGRKTNFYYQNHFEILIASG